MVEETKNAQAVEDFKSRFNEGEMRMLSVLLDRQLFMRTAGLQFDGRRDLYDIFGYDRIITAQQYRDEFAREGIAKRIVECYPKATWRGGVELYEDEDPKVTTAFEKAWNTLQKKHNIWNTLQNVDILAGLSTYSILLIGAPGKLDEELPKGNPNKLLYLTPFFGGGGPGGNQSHSSSGVRTQANDTDVTIEAFDTNTESPRFGEVLSYRIRRTELSSPQMAVPVHWSRVIHICEGALDNRVYGVPSLECIWNLLFCLEKVTGGGSESYFQRAKHTLNANIDKETKFAPADLTALKDKLEEYMHGMTNLLPTRGVDLKLLEAAVANFSDPVDSILKQIAGTKGIPLRILTGSEQGSLASDQDATNFDSQVQDRRTGYAGPMIVRKLVDRLIEYGYLPTPAEYEVGWPVEENMDENDKASYALKLAMVNKTQGVTVFTDDEIRDMAFNLDPLKPAQKVPVGAPERISVAAPPPLEGAEPKPTAGAVPPKAPALKAAQAEDLAQTLKALEAAIEANDLEAVGKILDLQEYKYGSTQVQLPSDVAEKLFALGRSIDDADLYEPEGGRETDAHVTVKYGLVEPDAARLSAVVLRHGMFLGKMGRISLTLGSTNVFCTDQYDVVYAEVSSPDLEDLNRAIETRLQTISTHGVYTPHATIAYVKPGTGKKYIGLTALSGIPVIADSIVMSDTEGVKTEISLMGLEPKVLA